MGDPRGDGIATIFVVTSASRTAEEIPAIEEAVDGRESTAYFSLNLSKGDRSPCSFKEEEKTCAELIGRWPGRNPSMFAVAFTAGHEGGHRDVEEANPAGFPRHGAHGREGRVDRGREGGGKDAVSASIAPRRLVPLANGVVMWDVRRDTDSEEPGEEVEVELLDGPRIFDDGVHDCVGAGLLDRPSNEKDGEEIKGVWPAETKSALPLAIAGEIEAGRAADNENKGPLRESCAKSPEVGGVITEEAPNVEASTLARGNSAFCSLAVPIAGSGSRKIWAELDEPSLSMELRSPCSARCSTSAWYAVPRPSNRDKRTTCLFGTAWCPWQEEPPSLMRRRFACGWSWMSAGCPARERWDLTESASWMI